MRPTASPKGYRYEYLGMRLTASPQGYRYEYLGMRLTASELVCGQNIVEVPLDWNPNITMACLRDHDHVTS